MSRQCWPTILQIEVDPEGREFYEEAAAAAASLAVCIDIFAVAEEVRQRLCIRYRPLPAYFSMLLETVKHSMILNVIAGVRACGH